MIKQQKEIPVYLFTGFLESGKTKFIQETLEDPRFQDGENTLLIVCEEGIEEYDKSRFDSRVKIAYIDEEEKLTEERLASLTELYNAERVVIEYNGMWAMNSLFMAFPGNWIIYQEMTFADSKTFLSYNQNMRQQTYDKLKTADTVVFNRCTVAADKSAMHKIVRAANRNSDILYEYTDGRVEPDTIEDPLPFDLNASLMEIEDRDYALWYRDMGEELDKYNGKKVRFKGFAANSSRLPKGIFVVGREVMTCCEADIKAAGVACETEGPKPEPRTWLMITAKISVKTSPAYGGEEGPVMMVQSMEPADPPEETVCSF